MQILLFVCALEAVETFLTCRADKIAGIAGLIKAYVSAALRALYFVKAVAIFIAAVAVAIAIKFVIAVTIAAIAIVIVGIYKFFNCAEVFVKFFNIIVESCSVVSNN